MCSSMAACTWGKAAPRADTAAGSRTAGVVAALVGVSRTMDYRHHATDVLSGAILGAVVGICMYHVYHHVLLPFYFLRSVE